MQRIISDPQDAPRNSPTEKLLLTVREGVEEFERPPTPRELFFEAGIVLAIALGAGVVVQLVLGSA
jgi:hypothetical protein